MCHDWPKPPIWPEDLPLIRELLTDEKYAELLKRMIQVLPNGPLLDYRKAFSRRPPRTHQVLLRGVVAPYERRGSSRSVRALVPEIQAVSLQRSSDPPTRLRWHRSHRQEERTHEWEILLDSPWLRAGRNSRRTSLPRSP